MNYTVEQLIAAIRDADTLTELKQMVGPSQEENERARRRVERIAEIWDIMRQTSDSGALNFFDEFIDLQNEQDRFEQEWGL